MRKSVVFLIVGAMVGTVGSFRPANADIIDPFFTETLPAVSTVTTCAANCLEEIMGLDPISGMTTLEYVFYNSFDGAGHQPIPGIVAGDVKVTEFGSSTVGDVIRFENVNVGGLTGSGPSAVAFIFSGDISGGLAADVGLPSTLQALTGTRAEDASGQSALWQPTTGLPGFCNVSGCPTGTIGYVILSPDLIPEPGTLAVLSIGLLGMAAARRRKKG